MNTKLKIELYDKWIFLNKNLKSRLKIKSRFEKKTLWNIIKETVKYDFHDFHIFTEFKLRPYEIEITELYEEKMAIKKIKPYLINYINWRLYNPDNGIRFLKTLKLWNKRF
tara:strand:+ start:91 stop:423 length:333 start_codon:yes stop_codon:yes gene_type:complete